MPRSPLKNLPLPALFCVGAGLWIAFQLVFHGTPITPTVVVATVIGGLIIGAVLTGFVAVRRHRLGGTDQVSEFDDALRTGTPPADIDRTRWLAELDRLDRTRTRHALLAVALTLLPIGLGVWGLTDPDARPVAVLLLLLFIAIDAITLGLIPARRRRVARLRRNLEQHPSTSA